MSEFACTTTWAFGGFVQRSAVVQLFDWWSLSVVSQIIRTFTALGRRRNDIAHLADVAGHLAVVDQRDAELDQRIADLLALATSP